MANRATVEAHSSKRRRRASDATPEERLRRQREQSRLRSAAYRARQKSLAQLALRAKYTAPADFTVVDGRYVEEDPEPGQLLVREDDGDGEYNCTGTEDLQHPETEHDDLLPDGDGLIRDETPVVETVSERHPIRCARIVDVS